NHIREEVRLIRKRVPEDAPWMIRERVDVVAKPGPPRRFLLLQRLASAATEFPIRALHRGRVEGAQRDAGPHLGALPSRRGEGVDRPDPHDRSLWPGGEAHGVIAVDGGSRDSSSARPKRRGNPRRSAGMLGL